MNPARVTFVCNGNNNLLGGWRSDKNRSFVCGFVDRIQAQIVKKTLDQHQYKMHFDERNTQCILTLRPLEQYQKRQHDFHIKTSTLVEGAFFVAVNNVDLMLIDSVKGINGKTGTKYVIMKNDYNIGIEIHNQITKERLESLYSGDKYDYFQSMQELDVDVCEAGEAGETDGTEL